MSKPYRETRIVLGAPREIHTLFATWLFVSRLSVRARASLSVSVKGFSVPERKRREAVVSEMESLSPVGSLNS
jgi:hypothetical protein